jgi:acetate---CoA ligase (ADP-forming)
MSSVREHSSGASTELRKALFAPTKVALVGASVDPGKASWRPAQYLRSAGYPVQVSLVNRHGSPIDGAHVYRSLLDVPERPDHVFIMTPTETVQETVEQCAYLGVTVATVLAGGFAEAGPDGLERQRRLVETARRGGVRLLGPNSIGLVNLRAGLRLTANAVFADTSFRPGGTLLASQSGSVIGALVSRGKAARCEFSAAISVGSEADLSIGEICSLMVDDDAVTSFALFLETIRHSSDLAAFADRAAALGKPVVAYKVGESEVAAKLAASHTGALAADDDVASAFLQAHGIARVRSLDGLLEAQPLARRLAAPARAAARNRVAVVSTTGGGAAMVVDQLGLRGTTVAQPTPETYRNLADRGVHVGEASIIDLTLAGTRYEIMKAALDVLLDAPEFDLVVAVVGSSARTQPELAVAPVTDSAGTDRPLGVFVVPDAPDAVGRLRDAGIPTFTRPETVADVISALSAWHRGTPARAWSRPGPARQLDEARSYERLSSLGICCAPYVTQPADAGLDLAARALEFPVAVKVLSSAIAHKSDVGGVVLGVAAPADLVSAVREMRARLRARDVTLEEVLVQQMVTGVGEFLVGYRVDAQVGPLVLLAAGGVNAELYRDRSIRLAPVDRHTASEMVSEVTASRLLDGFRNGPRGDRAALEAAVVAMSRLADQRDILEAEINPLVVHEAGGGATAVDAVVTVVA